MARTYAEGGGGYQLEYWVGAYYLAAMFATGHPEGDVGQVERVEFQRGTLGDVVVHGWAPGGPARLDLQVKTSLSVSATQGDFAKVIRQIHERVTTEPLRLDIDRYGIAVFRGSGPLWTLQALAERAHRNADADAFYAAVGALNNDERRVLGVMIDVLSAVEGVADVREAVWRILGSGLVVIELALSDAAGGPRSRLRSWIECRVNTPDRRQQIEDALYRISNEYDAHGGSLDRCRLDAALLAKGHRLTRDAEAPLLVTLASMVPVQTDEVVQVLPDSEADRVHVDLLPLVEGTTLTDPSAALEVIAGTGSPLRQALDGQGDRPLVLAGRAHIPLAALVGFLVTDRGRVKVLDWHPNADDETWSWPKPDTGSFPDLEVESEGVGPHVAIRFSLSFWVGDASPETTMPDSILTAVGVPDQVIHLYHPGLKKVGTLRAESVRSARQARAYGDSFRRILDRVAGSTERVDVFYAGPLSVAFELGRRVTRTFHPLVTVWNYVRPHYPWGVELNPRGPQDTPLPPRVVFANRLKGFA